MPSTSSPASSPAPRPHGPGGGSSDPWVAASADRRHDGAAAMPGYDSYEDTRRVWSVPASDVERYDRELADTRSSRMAPHDVAPLAPVTAAGGAVVAVVAVSLAATLDALISPGMGVLFGFVFVLTSVLVALRMCWYDAWAAVALPPLVFIVAPGLAAQVAPVSSGGWLHRTSSDMAIAVLDHPLYLLLGTGLAALAMAHRARVE